MTPNKNFKFPLKKIIVVCTNHFKSPPQKKCLLIYNFEDHFCLINIIIVWFSTKISVRTISESVRIHLSCIFGPQPTWNKSFPFCFYLIFYLFNMSYDRPKRNLKEKSVLIPTEKSGFETKTVTPMKWVELKMPSCGGLVVPMLRV